MNSSTVRINAKTFKILNEIVKSTGMSKQEILDKAIEDYRRKEFIREANAAYSFLKKDDKKWQEELNERREWDVTLKDGMEED